MITMNSDIMHTNHRRLENAFHSAAYARNRGALQVTIEWHEKGLDYACQYAFEKTTDGIYARLRCPATTNAVMRVHNLALEHGLPFSPTGSWARTDGESVTAEYIAGLREEIRETENLMASRDTNIPSDYAPRLAHLRERLRTLEGESPTRPLPEGRETKETPNE